MQSGSAQTPLIIAGVAAVATYVAIGHHGPIGFLQSVGLLHHHTASAKMVIDDEDDAAEVTADEAQAKVEEAMAAIPPITPLPNAAVANEMREVAPFDKIEFTEDADATVQIGDTQSVKVTGTNINTSVKDGKLVVSGHGGARIVVTIPHLRSLEAHGASKVTLVGLKDPISIAAHGPVQISATGAIESADLTIHGPSKLAMTKLETKNMTIKLHGFGDAEVFATETLNAEVHGVGRVRYLGDPRTVSQIHGMGSVEKLQS